IVGMTQLQRAQSVLFECAAAAVDQSADIGRAIVAANGDVVAPEMIGARALDRTGMEKLKAPWSGRWRETDRAAEFVDETRGPTVGVVEKLGHTTCGRGNHGVRGRTVVSEKQNEVVGDDSVACNACIVKCNGLAVEDVGVTPVACVGEIDCRVD